MCIRSIVNCHMGFTPISWGWDKKWTCLLTSRSDCQMINIWISCHQSTYCSCERRYSRHIQRLIQTFRKHHDSKKRTMTAELGFIALRKGGMVYRRNFVRTPGQSRKLAPLYWGTFLVLWALTNSLYHVAYQKRVYTWHHTKLWHDKLRKCHARPLPNWLRQRNLLMHGEHPFWMISTARRGGGGGSKVGASTGCTV